MYAELSGKSGRLSFDRKVCLRVGCLIALRYSGMTKMQFVILLFRDLHIFGGPEPLKTSKAIDSRCQSIEYAWARAVGQPRRRPVSFCGPSHSKRWKGGFNMAWGWINYQTVNSNSKPSTPFGTILTVRTPQARDKPGHRSHQEPDIGKRV